MRIQARYRLVRQRFQGLARGCDGRAMLVTWRRVVSAAPARPFATPRRPVATFEQG
jgi:hypothetical protein